MGGVHQKQLLLTVEGNDDDFAAVEFALCQTECFGGRIERALSGQAALDFLKKQVPTVILLDLNLPGMLGYEVLTEVRSEPSLRRVPVVVLSSSSHPLDVARCYEAGANSYISKTADWARLRDIAESIAHYWFEISELPEAQA